MLCFGRIDVTEGVTLQVHQKSVLSVTIIFFRQCLDKGFKVQLRDCNRCRDKYINNTS